MDPTITSTIISGIIGLLGYMGRAFQDAWKQKRTGRKDEADSIAVARNKYRTLFLRWRDYAYIVRAVAIRHHVPPDELPDPPPDLNQPRH